MSFPKQLICLFTLFALSVCPVLGQAEEENSLPPSWTELPRPNTGKGLFMEPRLLAMGSRVHMVWSGTTDEIETPEIFHSHISGGDKEWNDPRAPFFGKNKGRVRKIALGKTRNLVGLLFQRTLRQGNDAYEVLLAVSADQGWSWSNTVEIDSYNAEKTGGTAVSIEGRQGSNRPEFALSWIREYGNVRAANFDISSSLRPQGVLVGQAANGSDRTDVGTLGRKGFTVVFNNGSGLATAYVKGLIGKIEEGVTFLRGRYNNCFSVASRPYGPSRLAVGVGDGLEAYTSNDISWKSDNQSVKLPFATSNVTMESDMDEDKNLHVAMIRPVKGAFELWYVGQKKGKWGQPEMVHSFKDNLEIRGFDIAATDDRVFTVVSQGFYAKFFRKDLK